MPQHIEIKRKRAHNQAFELTGLTLAALTR
jgi:hypothetical protein